MKARKLWMSIAAAGLVFGMMTGCGGGGGSDGGSGGGGDTPDTGFTPEKIDTQVGQIADQLGCDYSKGAAAQSTQKSITLSLKTTKIIGSVIENKKDLPIIAESMTEEGNCGGSMTVNGDDTSANYQFDNYCTKDPDTGIQVELDGSLALTVNEAEKTITASTPSALTVTSNNPNTGEDVSVTVDLDKATVLVMEDGRMKITITSLTIKDNNEGKTFGISGFTANIDQNTGEMSFNGKLDNPSLDVGQLSVKGNLNSENGTGHVTATDQKGVKVELTTTSTEGVLDVVYDGAPLGKMDCSMAELPI